MTCTVDLTGNSSSRSRPETKTRQRGRERRRWLVFVVRRSWLRCQRCRSISSTRTKNCFNKVWRSWRRQPQGLHKQGTLCSLYYCSVCVDMSKRLFNSVCKSVSRQVPKSPGSVSFLQFLRFGHILPVRGVCWSPQSGWSRQPSAGHMYSVSGGAGGQSLRQSHGAGFVRPEIHRLVQKPSAQPA